MCPFDINKETALVFAIIDVIVNINRNVIFAVIQISQVEICFAINCFNSSVGPIYIDNESFIERL